MFDKILPFFCCRAADERTLKSVRRQTVYPLLSRLLVDLLDVHILDSIFVESNREKVLFLGVEK